MRDTRSLYAILEDLKNQGRNQAEIAEQAGCSASLISLAKHGKRMPREKNIKGMAKALGLSEAEVYMAIAASRAERKGAK